MEVKHHQHLVEDLGELLLNKEYTDVSLKVGKTEIKAHKIILASRSMYFKALFYGGLKETHENEITLDSETPFQAFEDILKYIYTGEINLENKQLNQLQDMISLADKYGLVKLIEVIANCIKDSFLSNQNMVDIYRFAELYRLSNLKEACFKIIEANIMGFLKEETYKELSSQEFSDIFSRDGLALDEMEIFSAAKGWIANFPESTSKEKQDVLNIVRLTLISRMQLLKTIWPSKVFQPEAILRAIELQQDDQTQNQRTIKCMFDQNVALYKLGARVLGAYPYPRTTSEHILLFDSTKSYDKENGFVQPRWSSPNGITISLGSRYWINSVRFLLWDLDSRQYSYTVEVYNDHGKDWKCVVNRSQEKNYRSWQNVSFKTTDLQYIRINGKSNLEETSFQLVYFEARLKN